MLPVSDTVEVNGKIDRVQQTENGEIEVLDYKTGKAKDQDYADESLQLSIYALAIETLLGKKPDRMTFHYLDEGQKVSSEMNAPKADETKARILEIASKIRQGAFQPIEEKHRYIRCKLCEYKPICPVWEK